MPRPTVRFLHASGLRLDVPPDGAESTPPLLRKPIATAGFAALQRLVNVAIEQDVDFLLLGGDSFCERDRSIAARAALYQAFARLAAESIPVFVVPGTMDPAPAWLAFPSLPENVILLTPDPSGDGPHSVVRDERTIAVVEYQHQPRAWNQRTASRPSDSEWRIAVLSESPWSTEEAETDLPDEGDEERLTLRSSLTSFYADFVTSAMPLPRQTRALGHRAVHTPGPSVARSLEEPGPHGASLVTLVHGQSPECERIALSPVAVLDELIVIERSTPEETLLEQLQQSIERHPAAADEEWLLARWTIRGKGPLLRALQDPEYRHLLSETINESLDGSARRVVPRFQIVAENDVSSSRRSADPQSLVGQALTLLEEPATRSDARALVRRELGAVELLRSTDSDEGLSQAIQASAARHLVEWLTFTDEARGDS